MVQSPQVSKRHTERPPYADALCDMTCRTFTLCMESEAERGDLKRTKTIWSPKHSQSLDSLPKEFKFRAYIPLNTSIFYI